MTNEKDELFALMFALGKLIRSRIDRDSLPMTQLETLRYIADDSSPTMHDVARHHRITAPSATGHVQELVRLGYLTRTADQKDRRQVRLAITPSGKRALTRAIERRKRIFEDIFAGLSANDRVTFNRILSKILASQ